MKIRNGLLALLVCILLNFLNPNTINAEVQSVEKPLPIKYTQDAKKYWTITLNQKVDRNTVNEQTIYILDENKRRVDASITIIETEEHIILDPVERYEEGKTYTIVVTNKVMNQREKSLNMTTTMPFIYDSKHEDLEPNWDPKLKVNVVDAKTGHFFIEWALPPTNHIAGYHAYIRLEGVGEDGKTRVIVNENGEKALITDNSGHFHLGKEIEFNKLYGFAITVVYEDGKESELSKMNSVIFHDTKPPIEEDTSISVIEKAVFDLTNIEREKAGLSPLRTDPKLMNSAREKSADMSSNNYFSHQSPTHGSPFDQMKAHGISYKAAGENIAKGYTTAEKVVIGWMNSPGHRANMLKPNYTHIGIGFDPNGNYWTQQFIQK